MYDHNGDQVSAEEVLAPDELADYYRSKGRYTQLPTWGAVPTPWPTTVDETEAS